jgi:outer membrane lipoprotein
LKRLLALAACGIWFAATGCASKVPPAIRSGQGTQAVSVEEARRAPDRHAGQRVRWGGSVLAVHNHADSTEIEILSRPLGGEGRPRAESEGSARFLARIPGFVDPAGFKTGRLVTVAGEVARIETRAVGDYPYRYPVIDVIRYHLWPEERDCRRGHPRGYAYYRYGPWYGPWYGPGPWPWYAPW